MPEPPLDPDALAQIEYGVSQFNRGRFFECHDTLEEVWQATRGPARDFLQGLIQVAVGFYHLDAGNLRGSESQLEKGLGRLELYGESYLGIDLAALCREARAWLDRIKTGGDLRAPNPPRIRFRPPARP